MLADPCSIAPNISVILPTLIRLPACQAIERLNRALQSVLNQRYPGQFEVLLIDDHSPEPVSELLDNAGLHYGADIKIIRLRRSNGLVQALNTGILAARYDLIARIDDDDAWLPGKIEKQLARFAADPDLSLISTGMRQVFENGQPSQEHIRPDGWSSILRFFCEIGCPFVHGSTIARKDIFRLLGGYPQTAAVRHCEDYALWSIWVRFFKPGMIEEVLYDYTVSAASVSSINAKKNSRISTKIKKNFTDLGINDLVFMAVTDIATILGVSVLQAGVVCYLLWYYRVKVLLPEPVLAPLRALLPDRNVYISTHLHPDTRVMRLEDLIDGFSLPMLHTRLSETVIVTVD